MKLAFFTSVKAVHSRKWIESLAKSFDVHVITISMDAKPIDGVTIHELLPAQGSHKNGERKPGYVIQSAKREAMATLKNGFAYAKQFAEVLEKIDPDIVHAHQSVPFGWYAVRALAKVKKKIPLIVSVWGTDVVAYPQKSILFRLMDYIVLKRATVITATGKSLMRSMWRWTRRRDCIVIPFGVDTKRFTKKASLSNEVKTFGIAKNLRRVNGVDIYGLTTAIKAMAIVCKTRPDSKLEIAGDGPMRPELEKLAQSLGIENHIVFLGNVEQEHLPKRMAEWDAYLLPSRQESFGVAALEAQAVGLPVIAANLPGVRAVVQNNITGVFVTATTPELLAQAMQNLDKRFLESAYKNGPEFVSNHYAWDTSVSLMKGLYKSV